MNPGTWIAIQTATQTAARNAARTAAQQSGGGPMTQAEAWMSAVLIILFASTTIYMIAVMIRENK